MTASDCHGEHADRLQLTLRRFQGGRTIARLLIALLLSLALSSPALAQEDVDASADGEAVEAQQEEGTEDSTEGGDDVEAQGEGENCNPNYEGECLDQAGDYDCPEGEGDGPNFTEGEVRVVGEDEFELDDDGDDIGCDDQGGGGSSDDGGDDGSTPRGGVDSGLGGTATRAPDKGSDSSVPTPLAVLALIGLGTGGFLLVLRRRA